MTVSGVVIDSTNPTKITVTLEYGNTVAASVTVNGSGTYTFNFDNIPNGVYNLVADNGNYKVTQAVTVSGGNVTVATIDMDLASGKTQSVVDIITGDTPPAAVGGLPVLFDDPVIYTPADKAVVNGNGTVEMKLAVEKQDAPEDAGAINTAAGSNQSIGLFLEINVIKSHFTEQSELTHEEKLPDLGAANLLTITFELPQELSGKTIEAVYRLHEGSVNTLTTTSIPEYFEQRGDLITLHVHKFSTYALAYTDTNATVSFNSNGGSGSMAAVTVAKGGSYTLPANSFYYSNYSFSGWKINNTGNILAVGTLISVTDNITLYAQWTYNGGNSGGNTSVNNYITVSFNANGGSGSKSSVTVTAGNDYILPGNPFTNNGYMFIGWKVGNSGNILNAGSYITVSANITLYAQWTANDGSGNLSIALPANGAVTAKPSNPSKDESVTITVKADAGYELDTLVITDEKGSKISYTENGDGTLSFKMPSDKITVMALFKKTEIKIVDRDVSALLNTTDHKAYVSGHNENKFVPNESMTRAEATQMLYNLLRDKNVSIIKTFTDVPENAWYATAVNTLASLGIISGYPDGNFCPDNKITRAEFAVLVVKFAKVSPGETRFTDVPATYWAYDYVNTAANFGWVSGVGGGRFEPYRNITRAEAVTLMNRVFRRYPDKAYIDAHPELNRFSDVDKGYWAYYDVIEASTKHEYERDGKTEVWKKEDDNNDFLAN